MTQPLLPQPQLEPTGITSEQYEAYTLQKLELWNGFYNYGGAAKLRTLGIDPDEI